MTEFTLKKETLVFSITAWLNKHYAFYPDSYRKSFSPLQVLQKYHWVAGCDGKEIQFNAGENWSEIQDPRPERAGVTLRISRNWCVPKAKFKPYEGEKPLADAYVEALYNDYVADNGKYFGGADPGDDLDFALTREERRRKKSKGIEVDPRLIYGDPENEPHISNKTSPIDTFFEDADLPF